MGICWFVIKGGDKFPVGTKFDCCVKEVTLRLVHFMCELNELNFHGVS